MKYFLLLIGLSLLTGSCSITKRRYNTGWHVEWHKKHQTSDEETASVANNRDIRVSETTQMQDPAPETVSAEESIPASNETQPVSLTASTEPVSSTTDAPAQSVHDAGTPHSAPTLPAENITSDDEPAEPKREAFPNSERVIPVPLAIILSIIVFTVGVYLSMLVGGFLFLALSFGLSSFTVIGSLIGIFFGALTFALVLFLIFQLFNRKQTKYASKRERNLVYFMIALCIAGGIGLLALLAMSRTAWS